MQIQTSRFGEISVENDDLMTFPEGILGFSALRTFVLLDDPQDEIFAWLQSCEEPKVAFPVLEPELFTPGYTVSLTKHDLESLEVSSQNGLRFFTIITIPSDPTLMTANLKAPVVINVSERRARQIVLQDNSLAIREPIFSKLQSRVVQHPQSSLKSQAADWGVAVRLPADTSGIKPLDENPG